MQASGDRLCKQSPLEHRLIEERAQLRAERRDAAVRLTRPHQPDHPVTAVDKDGRTREKQRIDQPVRWDIPVQFSERHHPVHSTEAEIRRRLSFRMRPAP